MCMTCTPRAAQGRSIHCTWRTGCPQCTGLGGDDAGETVTASDDPVMRSAGDMVTAADDPEMVSSDDGYSSR